MPTILHRFSIAAPPERVRELLATRDGVAAWWTGRPLGGTDGNLAVFFGERPAAAATFEVVEQQPDRIAWRCVDGPSQWIDTTISFRLEPWGPHGTTLHFRHDGWQVEDEFLSGCCSNWGAYLGSLKIGAETGRFHPYPEGEMSRWGA
jgi:uncharacterized protein YndB with AHSA1/START domain